MLKTVLLLFSLVVFGATGHAAKDTISGQVDATLAQRTLEPRHLSSEALTLFLQYKKPIDFRWRSVLSLQESFELAYIDQPDYNEELRADASDLRFQDTYVERRNGDWQFRAGWQQLVWGETFGSSPADVVNPKDLRRGLPLDQSRVRLATPMVTLKQIGTTFSWEALVIPAPSFNVLPLPGSDYSPPLAELTGFSRVTIERERGISTRPGSMEWGGRVTGTLGPVDLSVFHLNGYDRMPWYEPNEDTAFRTRLGLQERHQRVQYSGASLAADVEGYILRAEGVIISGRRVPSSRNGLVDASITQENAYAASLDFPTWQRLNVAVQVSGSVLGNDVNYFGRERETQYAGLRAQLSVGESSTWETIAAASLRDKGTRVQTEFASPFSDGGEWRAGLENQGGPPDSEFGRLWRASKVYIALRFKFSDER